MSASLDELYFDWLYGQVCSVRAKSPSKSYRELLHILYTTEFLWLIPNDDNRVQDGKDLRYEFLNEVETPRDHMWLRLGCSFLEFLIALSRRAAFETEQDATTWFWELLENLALNKLNDRADISHQEVDEILDRVIWRTYNPDGSGGLFPLLYFEKDQRGVEVWYQLNEYIDQRY
jgi:hypothetical protein